MSPFIPLFSQVPHECSIEDGFLILEVFLGVLHTLMHGEEGTNDDGEDGAPDQDEHVHEVHLLRNHVRATFKQ